MRTQGTITMEDVDWELPYIHMYKVGPTLSAKMCPCEKVVTRRIVTPLKNSARLTCNVYLPCGHACAWDASNPADPGRRLLVAPEVLTRLILSL